MTDHAETKATGAEAGAGGATPTAVPDASHSNVGVIDRLKAAITPGGEKFDSSATTHLHYKEAPQATYENVGLLDRIKAAVTPGGEKFDEGGQAHIGHYHETPQANYENVGLIDRIKAAVTPGGEKPS